MEKKAVGAIFVYVSRGNTQRNYHSDKKRIIYTTQLLLYTIQDGCVFFSKLLSDIKYSILKNKPDKDLFEKENIRLRER